VKENPLSATEVVEKAEKKKKNKKKKKEKSSANEEFEIPEESKEPQLAPAQRV
jgi:hypothetical protein